MPDSIKKLPLEGELEIDVNVILEAHSSEIRCSLESIDASELIETQFTKE
jgi:hypothetical protein